MRSFIVLILTAVVVFGAFSQSVSKADTIELLGMSLQEIFFDDLNLVSDSEQVLASANTPSTGGGFSQASKGPLSYKSLLYSARKAQSSTSRDCYRTSARTAKLNGGSSDGWSWPEDRSYRGKSLSAGLKAAIERGVLKPGMIIYASKNPGTDPSSMNISNLPHWFTYLGRDASGVDRFADQYATDFDLSGPRGIAATYGGSRRIDAFFDPYK
jgi:hypothetical protein